MFGRHKLESCTIGQNEKTVFTAEFMTVANTLDLYNIHIIGNYEISTLQGYFEAFFESIIIDYLLPRKTTINSKHRLFQYKTLNNVLHLNNFFFFSNSEKLNPLFVVF